MAQTRSSSSVVVDTRRRCRLRLASARKTTFPLSPFTLLATTAFFSSLSARERARVLTSVLTVGGWLALAGILHTHSHTRALAFKVSDRSSSYARNQTHKPQTAVASSSHADLQMRKIRVRVIVRWCCCKRRCNIHTHIFAYMRMCWVSFGLGRGAPTYAGNRGDGYDDNYAVQMNVDINAE